jgi:hypothetical protein
MIACKYAPLIRTAQMPDGKTHRDYSCGSSDTGPMTQACELRVAIRNHRDAKWGGETVNDEQDALLYMNARI